MSNVFSAVDPLFIQPQGNVDPNRGLYLAAKAGKTPRDPRPVSGENTGVFIVAGQSLAAGAAEGLYTPTNASKLDNLNIFDGAVYAAADPLLGHDYATSPTQQANTQLRALDQAVTAGLFQRIVMVPVAVGATAISAWDVGNATYTVPLHNLILVAARRAAAHGYSVTGILWQLGETDCALGTSQAAYTASFNSMKAKVAAEISAPWLVAQSTYFVGGVTSSGIRAAQAAVVDGVTVFAGPDTDTLGSSSRYDDQHFNATGNAAAATLWFNALNAVF